MLLRIEAKAPDPVLRVLCADCLQDADRNHVFRLGKGSVQRHGAIEFAVVILRFPWLAAGHASIEKQWRVVHDGRRREAFFQRCGIDERLEA